MPVSKVLERKAKLHTALLDSAERRIAESTVGQLRARDLAADAGCSLGAIYNVFEDLDALILHVSLRTLQRIDLTMAQAGRAYADEDPIERMIKLANAYLEFVDGNHNLWRALFDHTLPEDYELPQWIIDGQLELFRHIEEPLSLVMAGQEPKLISQTARSLFAAMHGIITLSVERRVVAPDAVEPQMEFILRNFVKGLSAST